MTPEEERLVRTMTGAAHPLAEIFPLMEGEEFDALVEDIGVNGLRLPVLVTPTGLILDGRNRFRACREIENRRGEDDIPAHARVKVFITKVPEEKWPEAVLSFNLHRRHLSASQRAMTAARWGSLRGQGVPVPSQEARAREMSVAVETLKQAEAVLRAGDLALVARVEAGDVAVSKAAQLVGARKPKAKPRPAKAAAPDPAPESQSLSDWLDEAIIPSDPDPEPQPPGSDTLDVELFQLPRRRVEQSPETASAPAVPAPALAVPSGQVQGPQSVSDQAQPVWSFEVWKNLTLACRSRDGMAEMKAELDGLLKTVRLRIEEEEWARSEAERPPTGPAGTGSVSRADDPRR